MPKVPTKEREGGAGGLEALYGSDEFRMYCFKVLPCSKHYSHDWTVCPFAHPGEKARRRDPRVFKYAGVECPHVKEGLKCPRGDLCPFAHNIFECWLHPTRYRTQLCNEPASCRRKVCFFAHKLDELREPTNPLESIPEGGATTPSTPRVSMDGYVGSSPVGHQARHSFDIGSLANGGANSSSAFGVQLANSLPGLLNNGLGNQGVNPVELAAAIQQISLCGNGAQQTPQNDRVVQLLIMLLGEIARSGTPTPGPQDKQMPNGLPPRIPRASIDNHTLTQAVGLMTSSPNNLPVNNLTAWGMDGMMMPPPGMSEGFVPAMCASRMSIEGPIPEDAPAKMEHKRSMSSFDDAINGGLSAMGRVSVDNAALSVSKAEFVGGILANGHAVCRSSVDSMASDSYQVHQRQSTDNGLPEAFILH